MKKSIFSSVTAMLLATFLVSACGGGGSTVMPPGISGGFNTSGDNGEDNGGNETVTSPGIFSLPVSQVGYTVNEYESVYFTQEIVGTVDDASEGLYLSVDASGTFLIDAADVVLSDGDLSGTLILHTALSSELLPGTYYGSVSINACTDSTCSRHYEGSPTSIEVMYSVLPNYNADINCPDQYGMVFDGCVDPDWAGVAAWEMTADGRYVQLQHMDGANTERLVNWNVVETDEQGYGQVLDVRYNSVNANGSLRFPAVFNDELSLPGNDLTLFANGTLAFDIRVLDWAQASELNLHIECHYPCTTSNEALALMSNNEWQAIELAVPDLVLGGLDLSRVSTGLLIEPTWDAMQGVHYQLDNVRWVPGEDDPTEDESANYIDITLDAAGMTVLTEGSPNTYLTANTPSLELLPGWTTTEDKIHLVSDLEQAVDMSGTVAATLVVNIPLSYASSTVSAYMWVSDSHGNEARGFLTYLADHPDTWLELRIDNVTLDADDGFEATDVVAVGVTLLGNGGTVDNNTDALVFNGFAVQTF